MIPPYAAVDGAYRFLAARYGFSRGLREAGVRAALDEARDLATVERDEPAALFLALARRPRSLGGAWACPLSARRAEPCRYAGPRSRCNPPRPRAIVRADRISDARLHRGAELVCAENARAVAQTHEPPDGHRPGPCFLSSSSGPPVLGHPGTPLRHVSDSGANRQPRGSPWLPRRHGNCSFTPCAPHAAFRSRPMKFRNDPLILLSTARRRACRPPRADTG